jgi:gas vesicle protein
MERQSTKPAGHFREGGTRMEDESRLSYFFLGLGLGVAVGVLFAPKSGAETREFIRSKAGEGVDFVKQRSDDFKTTATDTIDRGKEALRRQKDSLSAAMDAGKQAYRDAVNNPSAE